ncbi:hypothetical protein AXF42_Ash003798 [Apostasia shenzhenica]|uniref:Uncharacterized protein n=1 Tax=Apostasia shenzhenica TaxID=1088818 RepID=A0A2I0AHZ5_9ASPA|nr:hypothetical protein AXF42_Ash003798 [Apostasia shenzhenica]
MESPEPPLRRDRAPAPLRRRHSSPASPPRQLLYRTTHARSPALQRRYDKCCSLQKNVYRLYREQMVLGTIVTTTKLKNY